MKENKYVLGLDLGVASIGWGCVELGENDIPNHILDHGVVTFKALDNDKGKLYNQDRRDARGSRRVIRRRQERNRRIKRLIMQSFNMSEKEYQSYFNEVDRVQNNNVYLLKLKGLEDKLTKEELTRILMHYSKNRGFKSNRKIDSDSEKGKMKTAINDIQNLMIRDQCTVTKAMMTLKAEKGIDTLHNTGENYVYGFERKDVEEEIVRVLDKQIEYGMINSDFKNKYLEIWSSQRDFSEGPAEGSPYSVSFEKMFGYCKFRTKEKRVSRACPSFEIFMMIQKLQNLSYYFVDSEGNKMKEGNKLITRTLSKEDILMIYNKVFIERKLASITYNVIYDYIEKANDTNFTPVIRDLPSLSRKEFIAFTQKYKKDNNIESQLNELQYAEVKELSKKEVLKKEFISIKSYTSLRKNISKISNDKNCLEIPFMDKVATILSYAQTDKAIDKTIAGSYDNEFSKEEIALIKQLKSTNSGTGSLSLSLIQDLNKLMLEGLSYHLAMKELNYDHALNESGRNFISIFPTIKEIEETYETSITQPNVKHVLVYLRKLYIALVEEYGFPEYVHIEVARDIKNTFSTRMQIKNEQIDNQVENEKAKLHMAKVLGTHSLENKTYKNFSRDDIIKFRLWNDQQGYCLYTQEEINPNDLLTKEYEVDHILPFSRTFDDSYQNKVLVKKEVNQQKGNKTPYEYFKSIGKWDVYKEFIMKSYKLSDEKKNKLLLMEDISYDEFTNQSLHATSYVNKLAVKIFKDLLNDSANDDKVRTFKGNATSYLRKYYGLNNLTHSYESKDYNRNTTKYKVSESNLEIKNSNKKDASVSLTAYDPYLHEISYQIKVSYDDKRNEFRTTWDQTIYSILTTKNDLFICFMKEYLFDKDIYEIDDIQFMKEDNIFDLDVRRLAYELLLGLKANLGVKNRDNHFHHEIDALLVATMTRSMQLKITKFHQLYQNLKHSKVDEYYDDETGTLWKTDELKKKFNINTLTKDSRFYIPQPYDGFVEELKIKVFERDEEVLRRKLETLPQCKAECENAKVKYPSFQVDKRVSGKLHEDTIYGRRLEKEKIVNVVRKSIKEIKEKDLENIYDKDGGQKHVYDAIKKWMKTDKKGYPVLNNGMVVKKVKMKDENIEKMVQISPTNIQKGYAKIDEVARIAIYKKENDNKLYFVQISIDQYLKLKTGIDNFPIIVWWGQAKNNKVVNYNELSKKGYDLYLQLYPGQHIFLTLNTNQTCLCRAVGFGSGLFEIDSITGDKIDLIQYKLIGKYRKQAQITVSTIKNITPTNISILGEL